jgi:hypothetical protein
MAGWGWVCAQKQNGENWDWNACETIRQDGTYSLTVDPGVYRVIANPNWNSVGYSKITSDTATVGVSGITTLNMALATANVKLVINDLAGRPNYEGWVTVKDASGNYVDTGKGWISQLGKLDFTLTTGVYTLEIQPANNRTGVRTTETITVTTGVLLQRTITLAAGNIQGLAKVANGTAVAEIPMLRKKVGNNPTDFYKVNAKTWTLNVRLSNQKFNSEEAPLVIHNIIHGEGQKNGSIKGTSVFWVYFPVSGSFQVLLPKPSEFISCHLDDSLIYPENVGEDQMYVFKSSKVGFQKLKISFHCKFHKISVWENSLLSNSIT